MVATYLDREKRSRIEAACVRRARGLMQATPTLTVSEALAEAFGLARGASLEFSVRAFTLLRPLLTSRLDWAVDLDMERVARHLEASADSTP